MVAPAKVKAGDTLHEITNARGRRDSYPIEVVEADDEWLTIRWNYNKPMRVRRSQASRWQWNPPGEGRGRP